MSKDHGVVHDRRHCTANPYPGQDGECDCAEAARDRDAPVSTEDHGAALLDVLREGLSFDGESRDYRVSREALDHAEALIADLAAEREDRASLEAQGNDLLARFTAERAARETAEVERDEARAAARVLAHAYENDNRPPVFLVERALGYPVVPACLRGVPKGTPAGDPSGPGGSGV